MVQSCLAVAWNFRLPLVQAHTPASLVAGVLREQLGRAVRDYTFVDFCAGAGGPTPYIEHHLNKQLQGAAAPVPAGDAVQANGDADGSGEPVKFVLTDLYPHIKDWARVAAASPNISYVSVPVDATDAPKDLVAGHGKKAFRLYSLCFHHFRDDMAMKILKNSMENSDGFACAAAFSPLRAA